MVVIKMTVLLLALGYLLLSAGIFFSQKGMVYFPTRELAGTPSERGLEYHDVHFENGMGTKLHGWWLPHEQAQYTLLFCHGNGGNISHRLDSFDIFHGLGLNIFIFDYSGYGRSNGTPSEQATQADARAAWKWLLHEKNIPADQIIIFGRSLGGGVAAALAGELQLSGQAAGALILESTFSSVVDMGRRLYPWLPVKALARFRYESVHHLQNVQIPALMIHSPQDNIVPFELGRVLYESYSGPKTFLEIIGGHNNGFMESGAPYVDGLERFIASLANERPK